MRLIIFLSIFALFSFLSVIFRLIIFHPWSVSRHCVSDVYSYFSKRSAHNCPYGRIICYIAHKSESFGSGKTLSATRQIVQAYNKFNGQSVWCSRRHEFVSQRIHVLSNVDFQTIPYEKLVSLAQFVQETDEIEKYDDEHGTLTVTYLLIDEASSQLNSRSFKSNFDPTFISRLLTSRHVRANLILTSQRSGMVDKLMRDVTHLYISCQKIWRFEIQRIYNAYEVECAADQSQVAPMKRTGFFISDSLFDNYDTFASVQALAKSCSEGDYLSEDEIIALRSGDSTGTLSGSKRAAKRSQKRSRKR